MIIKVGASLNIVPQARQEISYMTGRLVMRARPEQKVGAALPSQMSEGARSPTSGDKKQSVTSSDLSHLT